MVEARRRLEVLRRQLGAHAVTDGHVHLDFVDGVAHLQLDHSARRNALTVLMMEELAEHVMTLQGWDGAAVMLSAREPGVFCAGGDLTELPHAPPEAAHEMALAMAAVLDGLLELPCVSVAALDGLAVGGGAELTTACDHRVGTSKSAIRFVQGQVGIALGWGGAFRLVHQIGRRAALRLLMEGRSVGANEGGPTGLFDAVVEGDAVEGALGWLAPVRSLAPQVVRAMKRQVVAASPRRLGDDEAAAFASVWGGPANQQALVRLQRHRR